MTFCMNVSRFMNLAAIFSLDLESQYSASVHGETRRVRHRETTTTKQLQGFPSSFATPCAIGISYGSVFYQHKVEG